MGGHKQGLRGIYGSCRFRPWGWAPHSLPLWASVSPSVQQAEESQGAWICPPRSSAPSSRLSRWPRLAVSSSSAPGAHLCPHTPPGPRSPRPCLSGFPHPRLAVTQFKPIWVPVNTLPLNL